MTLSLVFVSVVTEALCCVSAVLESKSKSKFIFSIDHSVVPLFPFSSNQLFSIMF